MMISKKMSRIIAFFMLIFAVGFFVFAITHPTGSFPWGNEITYLIYAAYLIVMVLLFIAPFKKRK